MAGLRPALRAAAATTGVFDRLIRQRTFDGALVLCYHAVRSDDQPDGAMPFEGLHVRRATFAAHCDVLKRLCTPLSLTAWATALAAGAPLPPRPVLVTFDDGYRSVVTNALPVLEQYGVPASVFVCSEPVMRSEMFWYDAAAMTHGEAAVAELKTMPYDEWRGVADRMRTPVTPDHPAAPLSPAEVGQLARHELVELGGHTHRHPILARAGDTAQRAEIVENLDAVEEWTGHRPRVFAYPNGRRGVDFTAVTEGVAADSGIERAFSTDEGFASASTPALALPRFVITAGLSAEHLLHRLATLW